jgi:hypothetical protein
LVIAESFLTEESIELVQFPSNFFYFASFGVRSEGEEGGRASGGLLILFRSSVFSGSRCKLISKSLSHLAVQVAPINSEPFALVGVYRTANEESAVFDPNFFVNLRHVCSSIVESGLSLIVAGDFNAKIGNVDGAFGEVDEFADFLPLASESGECNGEGADMLGVFAELEFHRLPFADMGVEKLTFVVLPSEENPRRTGGSIIDHVFFSSDLRQKLLNTHLLLRDESTHCVLGWDILVDGDVCRAEPPEADSQFLTFDVEKVLNFSAPQRFVDLATDPQDFTVIEAYDTILDFIGRYTKKVTVSGKKKRFSQELAELQTTMRRVERLWRQDPFSDEGVIRGRELSRLARLCKERRDLEHRQEAERVRKKFWEAHFAGESFKAWKIAKTNVSGKGGGIRTSATQGISREAWENHFRTIYSSTSSNSLQEVQLSGISVPSLDYRFSLEEVRHALEKKRNHKAPGPDGIRIDFLRIFRYDDTICRALANFFTLVLARGEIPAEWQKAYLFILYKGKGDKTSPDSFRGITLKSHLLKLFETLLQSRLMGWMESSGLLPPEQLAYRAHLSGVDHIYTLNILREAAVARTGSFYAAFIDLRKAFPSVNRVRLLNSLSSAGASDLTVAILRRLYVCDSFQLLLDGVPGTAVFVVVSGVHEGSCLSPLLFIFFIRELPTVLNATAGTAAPLVKGRSRSTLVYADDVAEMSLTQDGLQVEIDTCYDFFEHRLLSVNPDKSEVMRFVRSRGSIVSCQLNFRGTARESVEVARYLGVYFDAQGNWKCQKSVVLSRSRVALGRCKVILSTVGKGNAKHAVNMFDVLVASIYRYGFGAWGPVGGNLSAFDELFVGFIRWLFLFPKTTSKFNILSCFGRRCAACDSLYLAAIQLAGSSGSRNDLWKDLVQELNSGRIKSKWYKKVISALADRRVDSRILQDGASVVASRKEFGIQLAQFCFHRHLNKLTNTSADEFRRPKPFGTYPFLLRTSPSRSRFLFSFLLCNWRWIDKGKCKDFPRQCVSCLCSNTAWHLLFECPVFDDIRDVFLNETGRDFIFEGLFIDDKVVANSAVELGKNIYQRIAQTTPQ